MALGPLTWWGVRHWLATRPWLQPTKPAYLVLKKRLVLPYLWPAVGPLWRALEWTGLTAAVAACAWLIGFVLLLILRALRRPAWVAFQPLIWALRAWDAATVAWHCAWLSWRGGRRIARSASPRGRKVVMLVCSELPIDPRVEREARALAAAGFPVKILCPAWEGPAPPPRWGPGIEVRILPFKAGRFGFRFPYILGRQLLRAARAERDVWAFHAHDLNTALPALLAAAGRRVCCVCDFHEWYSENVSFSEARKAYQPHPPHKRRIYRAVERVAIHSASAVITVCDSIAVLLERQFQSPRPIGVIRNIPPLARGAGPARKPRELRWLLGLSPDTRILLYQGGVGPSRNLEPVIRAMALVPGAALVLRGPGMHLYGRHYLDLAAQAGCRSRVFCLPPVPSADVVVEARAADFGLWTLLSDVGLNFRLALPNKIFEYLAAGLPLLVADLPEARRIVQRYGVGLCFDPDDPAAIAAAVNRLADDTAFRRVCQANIPRALDDMQADREWEKLVQLYQLLAGAAPAPGGCEEGPAPYPVSA
jgi:glycosyltransferase involved in cell wall biosynthesis